MIKTYVLELEKQDGEVITAKVKAVSEEHATRGVNTSIFKILSVKEYIPAAS